MNRIRSKSLAEYQQSDSEKEIYSDFHLSFLPHPHSAQLVRVKDVDAVKQSLRSLILTNKYERLKNPRYGCNIRRHLFELFRPSVIVDMKSDIEDAIRNHEPRVRLIEVNIEANEDESAVNINIEFVLTTVESNQNLELTLYRVR